MSSFWPICDFGFTSIAKKKKKQKNFLTKFLEKFVYFSVVLTKNNTNDIDIETMIWDIFRKKSIVAKI